MIIHTLADSKQVILSRKEFSALLKEKDIGKEYTTLLHYRTFLTHLRGTANHNELEETIDSLGRPTTTTILSIIKKRIEQNPFGIMRIALKLKSKLRKNGTRLGMNEIKRLCLGELIQQTRMEAGMERDNSNNKDSYRKLWKTFNDTKERVITGSYPEVEEDLIKVRCERVKRKVTRPIRKRENSRQQQRRNWANKRKIPLWYSSPRSLPTDTFLSNKLEKTFRKSKLRINTKRLQEAKEEISEHYKVKEKEAGGHDPNSIAVALWNVGKNAGIIREAITVTHPPLIPEDVQVIIVVEASVPNTKNSRPQTIEGFKSSTVGTCQILVKKPATLTELDFIQPPPEVDPGSIKDTTTFLACKIITNKQAFTTVSAYFSPTATRTERLKQIFQTFVTGCMEELDHGPVIIGADLNFEYRDEGTLGIRVHHAKLRKKIWHEVWDEALQGKGALTPISTYESATHRPENGTTSACLDVIFLLTSTSSPAVAYPALGRNIDAHLAHSLMTGFFKTQAAPPQIITPEAQDEVRVKWEKIRYDNEKQNEFQGKMEGELRILMQAEEFNATTIAKKIVETGGKELGTITIQAKQRGANPKILQRKGTSKNRNKPWWDKELDKKAKNVTHMRRKHEEKGQKLRKRGDTRETQEEFIRSRRELAKSIGDLGKSRSIARRNYYDRITASKTMKNPAHVSEAHKIRNKILGIRTGVDNEIKHNAKEMNQEWNKIFKGQSGTTPPNEQFLQDTIDEVNKECEDEETEEITITSEQIQKAQKGLKLNKAPGLDGVVNEAIRLIEDENLIQGFAAMFSEMVNDPKKIAPEWKKGLIALIAKKDNPKPLDFRPIALLSHLAKFMELAVKAHLEEECNIEGLIGVYQMGFRKGRGVEEASLTLMAIDEICRQQKKPLIGIFLDIKKAYDSVPAKVLAASLKRLNIPPRLIRFLFEWVSGHKRKLIMPENDGDDAWLEIQVGVPQGSILAPFLFACVMDTLDAYLKGVEVLGLDDDTPSPVLAITPMTNTWRAMMFADDTTIFAHSITDTNTILRKIAKWSKHSGMIFHPEKFECLRLGYEDSTRSSKKAPMQTVDEIVKGHSMSSHIKYNESKLPVATKAKHLGLHKNTSIKPGGPEFTNDLKKRLKKADISSSAIAFAYKVNKNATTVHFASNIHRVVAEGAAYFGAPLCEINSKQAKRIRRTIGNAAKRGLGIYKGASTTLALKFLGWQEPKTVIALRRVSLLNRAIGPKSPAEIKALTKTMIKSNDECFPSPYLNLLNSSVAEVVEEETREEIWPKTREEWATMLDDDGYDVDTWCGRLCKGITYNHQHPMIRTNPKLAATAFRFICPSLKPYNRKMEGGEAEEVCQVCGEGENTGIHLLTKCNDEKIKVIREKLKLENNNFLQECWEEGRRNGDYALLNNYILSSEPEISSESGSEEEKIKNLILIKEGGNDLDVLARVLRTIFVIDSVNSQERLNQFLQKNKIKWQDMTTKYPKSKYLKYKSQLYTAYNWIGIIVDELWTEYCKRDTPRAQQVEEEGVGGE